jgi:hypothetical protein
MLNITELIGFSKIANAFSVHNITSNVKHNVIIRVVKAKAKAKAKFSVCLIN